MSKRPLVLGFLAASMGAAFGSGCSSSSSPEYGCQDPTSGDSNCLACINSSCSSQVSAFLGCTSGAYVSCTNACKCGDQSCFDACGNKDVDAAGPVSTSCMDAYNGFCTCASMCETQCTGANLVSICGE